MVRSLRERGGAGKLRNYWEEKVHVVIERRKESSVYVLKAEDGSGIERILHRTFCHVICCLLRELSVLIRGSKNPKQDLIIGRTLLIGKFQIMINPVTTMYTESS